MTLVQMLNMTFDVWSALFSFILILGAFMSRGHNRLQSGPLIGALSANAIINVAEAFAYIFRGDASMLGWWMVRISNFTVFLFNHLLLFFAAIFVFRTIEKSGGRVPQSFKRALFAIVGIGVVLLVISRIFGFYYAFDDQNRYYRLDSYWVLIGLIWLGGLALLVLTLANRKHLSPIEQASFIMFETLPVIAIIAQLFAYGVSLTTFACTISLTLMFMAYQMECSRAVVAYERNVLDEVIAALSESIDAKDPYTCGHSGRVARYSRMLAKRMGLNEEEVDQIYRTAMLHDIGKIGVPDVVLNKPGKLTDEEFEHIKSHAARGGDILSKVKTAPGLSAGARWHHERFDGKGYPDGLIGEASPLAARIICVADSYDAMTSDRVYRDHLPQDVVRSEIENNAGTQFDPKIAKLMLEIIDEDTEYELRE